MDVSSRSQSRSGPDVSPIKPHKKTLAVGRGNTPVPASGQVSVSRFSNSYSQRGSKSSEKQKLQMELQASLERESELMRSLEELEAKHDVLKKRYEDSRRNTLNLKSTLKNKLSQFSGGGGNSVDLKRIQADIEAAVKAEYEDKLYVQMQEAERRHQEYVRSLQYELGDKVAKIQADQNEKHELRLRLDAAEKLTRQATIRAKVLLSFASKVFGFRILFRYMIARQIINSFRVKQVTNKFQQKLAGIMRSVDKLLDHTSSSKSQSQRTLLVQNECRSWIDHYDQTLGKMAKKRAKRNRSNGEVSTPPPLTERFQMFEDAISILLQCIEEAHEREMSWFNTATTFVQQNQEMRLLIDDKEAAVQAKDRQLSIQMGELERLTERYHQAQQQVCVCGLAGVCTCACVEECECVHRNGGGGGVAKISGGSHAKGSKHTSDNANPPSIPDPRSAFEQQQGQYVKHLVRMVNVLKQRLATGRKVILKTIDQNNQHVIDSQKLRR